MLFNSLQFLVYFPIVVILYFLIPFKYKWVWLLGASYYFYMKWNPKYALLILASTIITYLSGIYLERANEIIDNQKKEKIKKIFVGISFISNLSILFFYKYFNFLNESITAISNKFHFEYNVPDLNILLPVGISFYTFQALSYTMDVYRENLKAEKHFGKYALFVSFFPQLVAGPIERTTHLLPQFYEKHSFDYERMKDGLLIMLWGFFKKVVVADRIAVLVNTVYDKPTEYTGFILIFATVLFTFQIYCDFSAYSDIAIGCARIMGFDLMINFDRPYLSKSIGEFWRRWHISLGAWFRDYLYFPLGGNRVSKIKFFRNIIIVFLVSGLWHGASWKFLIWGGLHGFYQIFGYKTLKFRKKLRNMIRVKEGSVFHSSYQILTTFLLVAFAWIFFRANSFSDAGYIIKNIFHLSEMPNKDMLAGLGLGKKSFALGIFSLIILCLIDLKNESYKTILNIKNYNLVLRYVIYYSFIFSIIIFGYYGNNTASDFIYFQF